MSLRRKLVTWASLFVLTVAVGVSFVPNLSSPVYAQATPAETSLDERCEMSINPLTWAICPVVSLGLSLIEKLDEWITDALIFNQDAFFNTSSSKPENAESAKAYKAAWSAFRFIAVGLIFVVGLVIVISHSLGFEMLDTYSLKKALPRLIVAIIAINISWPVFNLFIGFINALGVGIRNIIFMPFAGISADFSTPTELWMNVIVVALGKVALNLGLAGLASLAFSGALALLIAFAVIAIRDIGLQLLIILSPVAFVAYVLPNTQKIWSLWSKSLMTLLVMFPLMMGVISAGHVFSVVASRGGAFYQLLSVVAYFAPYFMMAFMFRLAGGVVAQIGGIVNDSSRGLFDRQRNFRAEKIKENKAAEKAGNRFKGKNFITRRANRFLEGTSNIGEAGLNPLQMRSKMRTALNDSSHDDASKFMKENEAFQAIGGDDAKLAGARYTNRSDIERELARFDRGRFRGSVNARARADAATQILRAQREAGEDTFQKARVRAMAGTGTGYQYTDENGNTVFGADRMLTDINEAYGNDRNGAGRALAEMRGALTNSGQIAGQAGFGTWAGALESRYRGTISAETAHNRIMDDAINSAQPGHAIHGKPTSAAAMGAAHARRIQAIANGVAAGTRSQDDLDAATAAAAGILDAMGHASPGNASAFANELMGVTIVGSGQLQPSPLAGPNGQQVLRPGPDLTVRDMIQDRMDNEEYRNRRRDWGSNALASANAQQAANAQNQGNPPAAPGGQPGTPSDSRLKRNIQYLTTVHGVSIYKFKYFWSDTVYVGVIAQELIKTHPDAVSKDEFGFYRVDYSKIGLKFTTYNQWMEDKNIFIT
ncbi:tail fiber domain-containing protein [Candidatus Saccharibacteria bacterium]|nr:tail fiber domain-containing protein [Candidatus Saccharibacteria bacterium]